MVMLPSHFAKKFSPIHVSLPMLSLFGELMLYPAHMYTFFPIAAQFEKNFLSLRRSHSPVNHILNLLRRVIILLS